MIVLLPPTTTPSWTIYNIKQSYCVLCRHWFCHASSTATLCCLGCCTVTMSNEHCSLPYGWTLSAWWCNMKALYWLPMQFTSSWHCAIWWTRLPMALVLPTSRSCYIKSAVDGTTTLGGLTPKFGRREFSVPVSSEWNERTTSTLCW